MTWSRLLAPALLAVLAAPAGLAGGADGKGLTPKQEVLRRLALQEGPRLAQGGFPLPLAVLGTGAVTGGAWEPAFLLRRRLADSGEVPFRGTNGGSRAVGDRLVHTVSRHLADPPDEAWEAAARPSDGFAGPSDWTVLRVPFRNLAAAPPVDLTALSLGLDNLDGRTVWPEILLMIEDPASPLAPDPNQADLAVADFDATTLLANPPPEATRPTEWSWADIPLSPPLALDGTFLEDGSMSDGFDRTGQPLENPGSDWIECRDAACAGPGDLFVLEDGQPACAALDQGCLVRQGTGSALLAVRFPDPDISAVRPWLETDQSLRVDLDLSDPGAVRAGLAARISASDTYYRIEYVKATDQVEVHALVQGTENLLDSFASPAPSAGPSLEVEVTGLDPVQIRVLVDGQEAGVSSDATHRLTGIFVGLSASDPAGDAEAWDAFAAQRRADLFALVRHPEGERAALPLDVSRDSLVSRAILSSTDGASFAPRRAAPGCVNPGNPFLRLEVEDTTTGSSLFEDGGHLVSLSVDCPGCPLGRNRCFENASVVERFLPVYVVGQSLEVSVDLWNEHLGASDFTLDLWIYDAPCALALQGAVAPLSQASIPVGTTGQDTGGVSLQTETLDSFVPAVADSHCLIVAPTALDGPTRVQPAFLSRQIEVFADPSDPVDGCTPKTQGDSNLDPTSLRVAKAGGDQVSTILSWQVLDAGQFPQDVNLHVLEAEPFDAQSLGFHEFAPIRTTLVGTDPPNSVRDLPAPATGRPLWLAVYETDGCPTGNSILP